MGREIRCIIILRVEWLRVVCYDQQRKCELHTVSPEAWPAFVYTIFICGIFGNRWRVPLVSREVIRTKSMGKPVLVWLNNDKFNI
uniref:Uncharacterized protein n=1 Tax=mine drainage metagenome TaxID=410659 RepID=E6QE27_9ZZZZ